MQVAEVLSDLTSLQVCDPHAALELVSTRPDGYHAGTNLTNGDPQPDDSDLQRAKDLVGLHASVKMAHRDGTDTELEAARRDVERVLEAL
ncbi:hypothetical protein BDY17DRAFT_324776 [Neohortaea acidophila]|uniref:Uncharacterized protein n=1 Tax=Neohortaea acidophila TaxID=245834 RepID=A0A6A6PQV7_9PEZI|nr:uncharacterized protein BDY17DRAFT_324776 [Neohortaea acidophila]KAF2482498.1 hypothetical protein BDY17DRAFT_324776 [Neohortaea acidophila]